MPTETTSLHLSLRLHRVLLSALAALLLSLGSCGDAGVDYAGGVGSGGSGLVEGAITGFGSVIVNGVSYDDLNATAQVKDSDGSLQNTRLKLGQRVQLSYTNSKTAQAIEVLPQLVGPVADLSTTAFAGYRELQVAEQWVRVIEDSNDAQNTVTQLEGFISAAEIALGMTLEVHGSWLYDQGRAAYVLVATRIEKITTAPATVLLSGVVQNLKDDSFHLNAVDGTWIRRTGMSPAPQQGDLVRIWVKASDLSSSGAITPIKSDRRNAGISADLRRGGLVSRVDTEKHTIEIEGQTYALPVGISPTDFSPGSYIVLERGANQTMPQRVQGRPRAPNSNGPDSDLGRFLSISGNTSNINWNAEPVQFSLRGVKVEVAQKWVSASCRNAGLGPVWVQINKAPWTANGKVIVSSSTMLQCQASSGLPTGTVNRSGTISALSGNTLTLDSGVVARWDSSTFFEWGLLSGLGLSVGKKVSLEGYFVGSVLQLKKIESEEDEESE